MSVFPLKMGLQMLEVNVSRQGQFQQSVGQGLGGYEQTGEPPKQVGHQLRPQVSVCLVSDAGLILSVPNAEHQSRLV